MNTKTFILPSGVECEVAEMTGKHQRILTEQKHKKLGDNLNEMLADLLVRVGDQTGPFTVDFVQEMLSADRRTALAEARMFSVGEPDDEGRINFEFSWKYTDADGNEQTVEKTVDLTDGFPTKPFYKSWKNYGDINKDKKVQVVLPRCGKTVQFTLLDGVGEYIGGTTKREQMSSHTPILMRNPSFMEQGKSDIIPVKLDSRDLDKLSIRDIEALRKAIKDHEGRIDTEIKFEHPEAQIKPKHEKEVIVDLLDTLAFFFPSQAI